MPESVFFLRNDLMNEAMIEVAYKCKCGARVSGKADRVFTDDEVSELKNRGCAVCYLKNILERDIQNIDAGIAD